MQFGFQKRSRKKKKIETISENFPNEWKWSSKLNRSKAEQYEENTWSCYDQMGLKGPWKEKVLKTGKQVLPTDIHHSRIMADLPSETMKARIQWSDVLKYWN